MSNFSAISWREQSYILIRWWCPLCTRPICRVRFL